MRSVFKPIAWLTVPSLQTCQLVTASNFDYSNGKIRGVNLGGWLVTEQWITPSLYWATNDNQVIDEWTYGARTGNAGLSRLQNHWNTWITESDFAQIASYGLNHVRIPIGYWSVPGQKYDWEPYFTGAYDYLRRGVGWAQKYGINVVIDLHGVPGSQNGFDNSGHAGPITWQQSQDNYRRSVEAIRQLTQDFVSNGAYGGAVTSIQPVNEPAGFTGNDVLDFTKRFYNDAYYTIRYPVQGVTNPGTLVRRVHGSALLAGPIQYPTYQGVALDNHYYSVFTYNQASMNDAQRIQEVCGRASMYANAPLWTYTGEWSVGTNDCAGSHAVLGSNRGGSVYEGSAGNTPSIGSCVGRSGNSASWSNAYKAYLRQYWEAQVNTFESGKGWIYWAWKQELADEWSYSKLVSIGVIPTNPTQRKYANPCDTSALSKQQSYSGAGGLPFSQDQGAAAFQPSSSNIQPTTTSNSPVFAQPTSSAPTRTTVTSSKVAGGIFFTPKPASSTSKPASSPARTSGRPVFKPFK